MTSGTSLSTHNACKWAPLNETLVDIHTYNLAWNILDVKT